MNTATTLFAIIYVLLGIKAVLERKSEGESFLLALVNGFLVLIFWWAYWGYIFFNWLVDSTE